MFSGGEAGVALAIFERFLARRVVGGSGVCM